VRAAIAILLVLVLAGCGETPSRRTIARAGPMAIVTVLPNQFEAIGLGFTRFTDQHYTVYESYGLREQFKAGIASALQGVCGANLRPVSYDEGALWGTYRKGAATLGFRMGTVNNIKSRLSPIRAELAQLLAQSGAESLYVVVPGGRDGGSGQAEDVSLGFGIFKDRRPSALVAQSYLMAYVVSRNGQEESAPLWLDAAVPVEKTKFKVWPDYAADEQALIVERLRQALSQSASKACWRK
jgi:hypothetical protein